MRQAKSLNDEEREEFCNYFYDIACEFDLDDEDYAAPWGCPWYFGGDIELLGETIKDMAENYYLSVKDEIIETLEIEKRKGEKFYLEVCEDNGKYNWSNEIGDYNDFETLEEAKEAIMDYDKCCDVYDEKGNEFKCLYRILNNEKNVVWKGKCEKDDNVG